MGIWFIVALMISVAEMKTVDVNLPEAVQKSYRLDVSLKIASGEGQAGKGTISVVVNGNKGSSGSISLIGSSDPVNLTPGYTYKFLVMVPTDVGNVQSVTFSWSHSSSLTDPLNWNILGLKRPTLYLDEIDVYTEEAGADTRFCVGGKGVETDTTLNISTKC